MVDDALKQSHALALGEVHADALGEEQHRAVSGDLVKP